MTNNFFCPSKRNSGIGRFIIILIQGPVMRGDEHPASPTQACRKEESKYGNGFHIIINGSHPYLARRTITIAGKLLAEVVVGERGNFCGGCLWIGYHLSSNLCDHCGSNMLFENWKNSEKLPNCVK